MRFVCVSGGFGKLGEFSSRVVSRSFVSSFAVSLCLCGGGEKGLKAGKDREGRRRVYGRDGGEGFRGTGMWRGGLEG